MLFRLMQPLFPLLVVSALLPSMLPPTVSGAPIYEEVVANLGAHNVGDRVNGRLVQAGDGNLYGTTQRGGVRLGGNIFRLTPDGELTVLYPFTIHHSGLGHTPLSGLAVAKNGSLYGSTSDLGAGNGAGAIFSATTQGAVNSLRNVYFYPDTQAFGHFAPAKNGDVLVPTYDSQPEAGGAPVAGSVMRLRPDASTVFSTELNPAIHGSQVKAALTEAADLNAYGVASEGGANNLGTVFRVTPAGVVNVVHTFAGADGSKPESPLVQAADGNLYGTTTRGGSNDYGTVFRLTPQGQLTTLISFSDATGKYPTGGVTLGPDGHLYGTTSLGGSTDQGTFYRITAHGELTTLASFTDATAIYPRDGITLAKDNYFYGTTSFGGDYNVGVAYRVSADGTITKLASFGDAEGYAAVHGVIQGADGNLYGAASAGGVHRAGTVFKVAPDGKLSTLASLDHSTTGGAPTRIVQAANEKLYGATAFGGGGQGTVFRVTTDGELDVIASLTPQSGQAATDLLLGKDGNLYGLAAISNQSRSTIFRVTPSGTLSRFALLSFSAGLYDGLDFAQDSNGSFFGTAGSADQHSTGLAFRVSATGHQTEILATFDDFEDGWTPVEGMTKGADGNYYGGTQRGGPMSGGIIYRITPSGTRSTVVSFPAEEPSGVGTRLLALSDGSFYGGTHPNISDTGALFRVTTSGMIEKYPVFEGIHGAAPRGLLTVAADGYIYGTMPVGGTAAGGVVYRFTSSKPQLTAADHTAAPVGSSLVLTGRYLAGVSTVSFGGVSTSKFTIDSSQQITVTVPPGAKAGPISVTNPLGTATTTFSFTPQPEPPRFVNISTRLAVLNGDHVLIGGFIITGTEPKKVIVRGIGPSLEAEGVSEYLVDPTLELNDKGFAIAINDNWQESQKAEVEASGIPPSKPAESAIVRVLAPGAYTVILRGKNGGSGVGLVEVYAIGPAADSRVANISTRGFVDTGNKAMIGGFIMQGAAGTTGRVLVRAIGPSLAGSVPNPLLDPTINLHDANGSLLQSNDNWKETQQQEITDTGIPPGHNREAALIANLPPGNYTAVVNGKNNSTGVALVELYNLR